MRTRDRHPKTEYLITACFIVGMFLFSCACKKIVPFGSRLLGNESDFTTQSVPIYMHLWDALHGRADLFFDWRFGLGSNFSGTLSHYSLISPFSLFFLFISRESIPRMMIWYILLKLLAMGMTMCCFLRNDRLFFSEKPASPWIIAGSAGYALSGYTAQYYGFPWVDTAVFVPLLFLCLNRLLADKEPGLRRYEYGYTLFLALIAVINIPQAFAVCLAVMGYACGVLFLKIKDRTVRGTACVKLICCSLLGIGLSMAVFLPAYLDIGHSYRMTYGNYGNGLASYIAKMDLQRQETYRKVLIGAGSLIPAGCGILSARKTDRTHRRFCFYLLFLAAAPILFESVNGIYHNGPYSCYPMRYGFLTVFLITAAGLSLAAKSTLIRRPAVSAGLTAVWAFLSLGLFLWQMESLDAYGYEDLRQAFIESEGELRTDAGYRVKQADAAMMENYPLYADLPALSNYVPLNSLRQVRYAAALGYAQNWVALDDAGGTVFTDMFMGVRTVITGSDYAAEFERLTAGSGLCSGRRECGENRYCFDLPAEAEQPVFITAYSEDLSEPDTASDPFENMNRLSGLLGNPALFETETVSLSDTEAVYTHAFEDTAMLYVWIPDGVHTITVNGTPLTVPVYGNSGNTEYPRDTNNGILLLGTFDHETAEVTITSKEPGKEAVFGWLNPADVTALFSGPALSDVRISYTNSAADASFTSLQDGYVILPFYADEGWTYTVNGVRTEAAVLYGMFPVLPVHAGETRLVMQFRPEGLRAGALLSVLSVILLAGAGMVLPKQKQDGIVSRAAEKTILAVWILYLLYVYIIPILFRTGMSLYKRLF